VGSELAVELGALLVVLAVSVEGMLVCVLEIVIVYNS